MHLRTGLARQTLNRVFLAQLQMYWLSWYMLTRYDALLSFLAGSSKWSACTQCSTSSAYLLTANEQTLQVCPCALDLRHELIDIRHVHELLVPAKDVIFEGVHVPVCHHALQAAQADMLQYLP